MIELDGLQEINFDGCVYCLLSPEDRDELVSECQAILAKLEAAERLRDALDGQVDGIADAIDAFDAVVKK